MACNLPSSMLSASNSDCICHLGLNQNGSNEWYVEWPRKGLKWNDCRSFEIVIEPSHYEQDHCGVD